MEDAFSNIVTYLTNHSVIFFQIIFSAAIGFLIGWDREAKSKPAGIKTYMYVCTACCLITLISIHSVEKYNEIGTNTMMDPMRLTAQIVSGLGFLGAGVILKNGLQVKGLTSAAMIFYVGGNWHRDRSRLLRVGVIHLFRNDGDGEIREPSGKQAYDSIQKVGA